MRQYIHWVESIQAGTNLIDDVETLEKSFDALSGEETIRNKFFDGVRKYIEDATIALIAIPAVTDDEKGAFPRFPRLLPMDVMSTFFILLDQKTSLNRSQE